ncbi:hypothetical protein V1509DRAFT_582580 [Lipomyces kononenkoae]
MPPPMSSESPPSSSKPSPQVVDHSSSTPRTTLLPAFTPVSSTPASPDSPKSSTKPEEMLSSHESSFASIETRPLSQSPICTPVSSPPPVALDDGTTQSSAVSPELSVAVAAVESNVAIKDKEDDAVVSPTAHPPVPSEPALSPDATRRMLVAAGKADDGEQQQEDDHTESSPSRPSKRTASGSMKTPVSSQPPSPEKGVGSSPIIDKDRIEEISSNLRTRLSYAMLKVQHGWTGQSLDELEQNVKPSPQHSPYKSPKPDYPHTLTIAPSLGRASKLFEYAGLNNSPQLKAAQVVIDEDENGHLSTTTSTATADIKSPSSPTHMRQDLGSKTYDPFWMDEAAPGSRHHVSSHPLSSPASSRSRSRSGGYTHLQFQPPLSANPNFKTPVQIMTTSPPPSRQKFSPPKSKGGAPITPDGLPALGTFSNKLPPSLSSRQSISPSPSSRRKGKPLQHTSQSGISATVADVAAVAAAAAEIEKEEAEKNKRAAAATEGADDRQKSEVDAIESLMFLSSPTTRSWSEADRGR